MHFDDMGSFLEWFERTVRVYQGKVFDEKKDYTRREHGATPKAATGASNASEAAGALAEWRNASWKTYFGPLLKNRFISSKLY